MGMKLSQIKYFLVMCEELNFTRAARRCGISQPSLTDAIKSLERELGDDLFQRRPISLTELGRAIRPHLRRVIANVERAKAVRVPRHKPNSRYASVNSHVGSMR
jgi:LysR family transcriptional regulator, hydrogen peroxide-inducible genes activator